MTDQAALLEHDDRPDPALARLAASEARFRAAMESVHGVLWTNSAAGEMVGEQPGWAALTGQSEAEYQGYGWAQAVHPDDAQPTIMAWNAAVAARRMFVFQHRVRRHDGAWRHFAIRAVPILAPDGTIQEWVGVHTDVTEQRLAAERLHELNATLEQRVEERTRELQAAQEALRQSQKMEAVGQLTGGIAHDFNNLLTAIGGSLDLLRLRCAPGPDATRYLDAAQAAASRAAALTHRLLAFSRQQPLAPVPTDANRLVAEMLELIARTVGPAIGLSHAAQPGLWTTLCDPHQLESALLNLSINARDAMPDGGRLAIQTANVSLDHRASLDTDVAPGDYVRLAVTDTGSGMTPEVAARAFDPFFTTKPIGQGTGLGLSMIYGFARQSGGQVRIHTQPGLGTTVSLYLPRHDGAEQPLPAPAATPAPAKTRTGGTILIVDDEPALRMLAGEVVADLGYAGLEAEDGAGALAVLRSRTPLDLLITDVGLPGGMNGRQLADIARALRPELKVLFITGYADSAVLNYADLPPGMEVLLKPFAMDTLADRINASIGPDER